MKALMDFENIKNPISQSVSVSENESPELWSFSLLVGAGSGEDKIFINNFSPELKASFHVHNFLETETPVT